MSAVRERLAEVPAGGGGGPAARQPMGEEKPFRSYDPDQVLLLVQLVGLLVGQRVRNREVVPSLTRALQAPATSTPKLSLCSGRHPLR